MKQEDMLERIRKSADDLPVPDELKPDHMMKSIKQKAGNPFARPFLSSKKIYGFGTVAALFVLVLISRNQFRGIDNRTAEAPASMTGQMTETGADGSGKMVQSKENTVLEPAARNPKSYEEIYQELDLLERERPAGGGWKADTGAVLASPIPEAAGGEDRISFHNKQTASEIEGTNLTGAAPALDYSVTNSQVEGIDEGDVVKTDGSYLYIANMAQGVIQIIKADGSQMTFTAAIKSQDAQWNTVPIIEFYLYGSYLSVIRQNNNNHGKAAVSVETYEISDKENPKNIGTVYQDGYYKNSRLAEGYLYLFTDFYTDIRPGKDQTDQYIPKVDGGMIPCESIYIPDQVTEAAFLVISSTSIEQPDSVTDKIAIMSGSDHFYVSQDYIYAGSSRYDYKSSQYDYTELLKFSYEYGKLRYTAKGMIDGYLNNQFSMDEYQGKLRVVTTLSHSEGKETNSLIILDENLNTIGQITDLAPGEQVYSARFMGDTGYFVTYKNTDPLFSVDLSDPVQPKILGELKITGFSEYLHPYRDGCLLGIGKETNPDTGNFKGLKLSMFDIRNPATVTESAKEVEETYEFTNAWQDHTSVLISPEQNLIGFSVQAVDQVDRKWSQRYVVYTYDDKGGFHSRLSYELLSGDIYNTRGVLIGDWLYVAESDRITVFSLKDYTNSGQIKYE